MKEKKGAFADKTKFPTLALDSVKLSIVHGKEKGEGKEKTVDEKTPRDLGPADTTIHTREEGPTVQLCGDSEVASKWMHGQDSLGQKDRGRIGQVRKTLYSWWRRRKIANRISKIDDDVKDVFREHNRDADRLANMGAEGQREKLSLMDAVILNHGKRCKSSGMSVLKDNSESGWDVVIEGVDRDRWVTNSFSCAEVAGVCVLAGILVLHTCKMHCFDVNVADRGRVRRSVSSASEIWGNVFCDRDSQKFTQIYSGRLPACASCGNAEVHEPLGRKRSLGQEPLIGSVCLNPGRHRRSQPVRLERSQHVLPSASRGRHWHRG